MISSKKRRVSRHAGTDKKKGESLVINNNIEISILEVRGDQIKIGITAPKDVPIYRKEVYKQIQEENRASVSAEGLEALKKCFDHRLIIR